LKRKRKTILPCQDERIKQCYARGEIHTAVESAEPLPKSR